MDMDHRSEPHRMLGEVVAPRFIGETAAGFAAVHEDVYEGVSGDCTRLYEG